MGNKVSSDAGSDAQSACAKVANDFAPTYVRAHGIAIVAQIRREQDLDRDHAQPAHSMSSGSRDITSQLALERPPVATEPLESGWLVKLGEVKKSWKRRYFVAAEESDNFCVRYFEKEAEASDPRKAKGAIYLAGYVPRSLGADEGYGPNCLALEPLDKKTKRTYYLRCDSEDQRQRWKLVLRIAALKCQPPLSPEPALATAFKEAYARTRRSVGLSGYYVIDRHEQEQLTVLCYEACKVRLAGLLGDGASASSATDGGDGSSSSSSSASSSLTGPSRKGGNSSSAGKGGSGGSSGGAGTAKEREELEKLVNKIATDTAAAAWAAASARAELRRDALQRRATDSLSDITRAEEELRQRLKGSLTDYVLPVAQSAAAPLLPALLGALMKPLYKSYKETVRVFFGRAQDILRRGLRERELRTFYRDARCQEGALGAPLRKLRALTRGEVDEAGEGGDATLALLSDMPVPLSDLRDMLAGDVSVPGSGYSLWEIETLVEDSLRQLLGWAIYSFVAAVERSRGGTTPVKCLMAVTRDMQHDAKLRLRDNVGTVLRRVITPAVRARALELPSVKEALQPASELHGKPSFVVLQSGGAAGSKSDGKSPASASSSSSAASALSVAAAVKVNKKSKAAAEAEVAEARVADLFVDADWAFDELVADLTDAAVKQALDASLGVYDAKLDKLLQKLGLEGGQGAGGAAAR